MDITRDRSLPFVRLRPHLSRQNRRERLSRHPCSKGSLKSRLPRHTQVVARIRTRARPSKRAHASACAYACSCAHRCMDACAPAATLSQRARRCQARSHPPGRRARDRARAREERNGNCRSAGARRSRCQGRWAGGRASSASWTGVGVKEALPRRLSACVLTSAFVVRHRYCRCQLSVPGGSLWAIFASRHCKEIYSETMALQSSEVDVDRAQSL